MKVKVCCARLRVTGTFSTSESTKTRLLIKDWKKLWRGAVAPPQTPSPVVSPSPHPAPTRRLRRLVALLKLNVWIRHWSGSPKVSQLSRPRSLTSNIVAVAMYGKSELSSATFYWDAAKSGKNAGLTCSGLQPSSDNRLRDIISWHPRRNAR